MTDAALRRHRGPTWAWLGLSLALLAGCAQFQAPSPIESRKVGAAKPADQRTASGRALADLAPVPEGFYRVRRGDTLVGIALEHGVDWRELSQWNQIDNPNRIDVGQVLRVREPKPERPASSNTLAQSEPIQSRPSTMQIRPLEGRPVASGMSSDQPPAANETITEVAPAVEPGLPAAPADPTMVASAPTSVPEQAVTPLVTNLRWGWPANGQVITGFSDGGSKGIAIAGAPGEAVFSAEQGRVVYSGNGLRGYGNLVIVKHPDDFITAYAHNRSILVKEGQTVKRGQKIAELGMSDADKPMLHFEVRRGGKPIDPMSVLPSR